MRPISRTLFCDNCNCETVHTQLLTGPSASVNPSPACRAPRTTRNAMGMNCKMLKNESWIYLVCAVGALVTLVATMA